MSPNARIPISRESEMPCGIFTYPEKITVSERDVGALLSKLPLMTRFSGGSIA
jgi:hypothetical protein